MAALELVALRFVGRISMTLYKLVGSKGEVIATLSCQSLKALEGKNRFEVIGFAAQQVGELKLSDRCRVETVGEITGRAR